MAKGFVFPSNRRNLTYNVIEEFFLYKKRKKELTQQEIDEWIGIVETIEKDNTNYAKKTDKTKAIKDKFIEKYYPALDNNSETPIADRFKKLK